ncbi:MAG: DUF4365 domain-containing protein [Chitinophagaceae bacterium]|nr:DUF4365 domain-containing protein [Chitinophagaceae bacterium]
MRPLTNNDIESELSYAYLHAVTSKVGASCSIANRSLDGNGIDASITGWGPFLGGGYLEEVTVHVQLKATITVPVEQNGHLSYFLSETRRYDDLKADTVSVPRILVVMFLPANAAEWLTISPNELIMKKCAYWTSLRGSRASTNKTGETVYLPKAQILDPNNLTDIFTRLSRNEILTYTQP